MIIDRENSNSIIIKELKGEFLSFPSLTGKELIMEGFITKYRPKTMSEVWGNDHIKRTWSGYLRKGYFPRSIILSSNFGMGKTTLARIMAEDIINFEHRVNGNCYVAEEYDSSICNFQSIHKNIHTMTGFVLCPVRVMFFDEAHRTPDKAQDGFLKKIEDIDCFTFIFATTDLKRIDPGIRSRSAKFNLKLPTEEIMIKELGKIAMLEEIKITTDALDFLIKFSHFFPRECLGNLERLSLYEGEIDLNRAKEILGDRF